MQRAIPVSSTPRIQTNGVRNKKFLHNLIRYRWLYLMAVPTLIWFLVFKWGVVWGAGLAFVQYKPQLGIYGSPFVGLQNFANVFGFYQLQQLLTNVLVLNMLNLVIGLPCAVLLALSINELKQFVFKRVVQTISYLPHFITWIMVGGMTYALFQSEGGILNQMLEWLGFTPVYWYQKPELWRGILVISGVWKNVGYSSILFIAALSQVSQEAYESAAIDGATRLQQLRHLALPVLLPFMGFSAVFAVSGALYGPVDQIFALAGGAVAAWDYIDNIDYMIFRFLSPIQPVGFAAPRYSYQFMAAMNLIQGMVGIMLFVAANWCAKRYLRWTGMF